MPVGAALDPATMTGSMASSRHRDRVEGYIRTAREEGARAAFRLFIRAPNVCMGNA